MTLRERIGCTIYIIAFFIMSGFGINRCNKQQQATDNETEKVHYNCTIAGGTYYCAYGSGCICLAPGIVLKVK